jgi:hypothetical protein
VATRLGSEKPCPTKRQRITLTPTGLLMEGVYTQNHGNRQSLSHALASYNPLCGSGG